MNLKVTNKTGYDTRTLKKLVRVIRVHGPARVLDGDLHVRFVYGRRGLSFTYFSKSEPKRATFKLPKGRVNTVELAVSVRTALWYVGGFSGIHVPPAVRSYTVVGMEGTIAALNLPDHLVEKVAEPEPTPVVTAREKGVLQEARYQNLLKREVMWQRKLKMAQTFLVKIRARKRYYERQREQRQKAAAATQESRGLRSRAKWNF